jgi:hypothetical protein
MADLSLPITFIFISSEGKIPKCLKNRKRLTEINIIEPNSIVGIKYLNYLGFEKNLSIKIENITGSIFKFILKIEKFKENIKNINFENEKIDYVIEIVDKMIYSDIKQFCQCLDFKIINSTIYDLFNNKNILLLDFQRNLKKIELMNNLTDDEKRICSIEILEGNLFSTKGIDGITFLTFQNRATKAYMKRYLEKLKKIM